MDVTTTAVNYEVVIGLEVHSQLLTKSKMFCSCGADYQDASPNTMVCEVCMGMPGVLPVINRRAVELVIATGLALECSISRETKFDRKNYPYPDLMKGYQISQYDQPIAKNGKLTVQVDEGEKTVGITRVHLEEDVAKLLHRNGSNGDGYSLLDINRAGVPLMETVSEPDMRSPDEAKAYLTTLHTILRYIGASTANMEEGSFRCDANISVRPEGSDELGAKVEVKNMNSFRSVHAALEYETGRQIRMAREGERIEQETRGWVDDRGVTVSQRSKEYASDYRYFPEPDLPLVVIEPGWVDEIRATLPELPQAKKARFIDQYALSSYDAGLLTTSKGTADFFETVLETGPGSPETRPWAKSVSNWMLGEVARLLNETGTEIQHIKVKPQHLAELIELVEAGTLSNNMAKTVFEEMFATGRPPKELADEQGMVQLSEEDSVRPAVEEAVSANEEAVADYLNGKDGAMRYLIGQVMRITKGKANPQVASKLVKEKLESRR